MHHVLLTLLIGVSLIVVCSAIAQEPFKPNYDEAKVPKYTLPDPLTMADGSPVNDAETWTNKRRPEILKLFETNVYGRTPQRKLKEMTFEVTSIDKKALGGKAIRKEVSIYFTGSKDGPKMDLLIYLPADAKKPVPIFLVPNFNGNHAMHADRGITLSQQWIRNDPANGVIDNRATEKARGSEASRFSIDDILAAGYGLVTFYYGDLDPDFDDGFQNGVHPLFR